MTDEIDKLRALNAELMEATRALWEELKQSGTGFYLTPAVQATIAKIKAK